MIDELKDVPVNVREKIRIRSNMDEPTAFLADHLHDLTVQLQGIYDIVALLLEAQNITRPEA